MSFFDVPPMLVPPEVDEVHISVTFSWDLRRAEWLGKQWEQIAPVKYGRPAPDLRSGLEDLSVFFLDSKIHRLTPFLFGY